MKKKWIMILLAAVLLAVLATVIDTRSAEDQLPPMVMAEGTLYRYAEASEGGPSRLPDGILTEFIGNRVPNRDGEYNFDVDEVPYWKYTGGICVYVKETGNYLLFEETDIQE